MEEKEKKSEKAKKRENIAGKCAVLAVGILLGAMLCCFLVGSALTHRIKQSQADVIRSLAQQNRLRAQAALESPESAVAAWAALTRDGNHTEIAQLLESATQGSQLLGCNHLYLMDEDGLFYGSDGSITQRPTYEVLLNGMESDSGLFFHDGDGEGKLLVCVKLKPFSVEGESFFYALAEFSPESVFVPSFAPGSNMSCCILDSSGRIVVQLGGSVFETLKTARLEGYLSAPMLKNAIPEQERLEVRCTAANRELLLVSEQMEGRDLFFLTLCPLEGAFSLPEGILFLPLAVTVLLSIVSGLAAFLLLGLKHQKRRTKAAQTRVQALEEALDDARETNRVQLEQQKQISHDIRTPLNVIVGYTALANRHLQEPEVVCRYLEKITESSEQLLAKSDEGLEKERTAEDTIPPEMEDRPMNLAGKRVLLVEDNRLNREIAADILSEAGMLVESASNGKEGFQKLSLSHPGYFDVVLMDIQMPVMDGCEATKTIRRLRSKMLAEIPIIAMTASVSDEDKRKAFQAGMDGYVEKPMDISKLLRAIQNALRRNFSG